MSEFQTIDAGEVRLRAKIAGQGPLVIMVHGFPESWYSWRHQIGPVAAAGFKVCAIDVRGYGGSDKPKRVEDYAMQRMIGDIIGVADVLQPEAPVILIGHDWGAPMVWNTALTRPDRIAAVCAMSVIFAGVPAASFDVFIKEMFDSKNRFFYQSYFRDVGRAEAVFDANPRAFLRAFLFAISGEARPDSWPRRATASDALLDVLGPPGEMPWLSEADLDYYENEFKQSGFFGPLSRYRNHTRDWEFLQAFKDRKIHQPALFIAGDKDPAYNMFGVMDDPVAVMRAAVPNLEDAHVLPGCGHWTQQERPVEVNAALLPWLQSLKGRVV